MGFQTDMPLVRGLAPGLDSDKCISNIMYKNNTKAQTTSVTLKMEDSGKVFSTIGAAGAVTFTLPAVATSRGCTYTFINGVDQNMVITAPAGTLVADGNAAATSATFSTASHKIGGACHVICDGTKWYLFTAGNNAAVATIS